MRLSSTARGFLIILAIAVAITALQLELALGIVFQILRIAFIVVIAFFLYRLWRNNRSEISLWSRRSQIVFYGAAVLALVNVIAAFVTVWPSGGPEALIFFFVLAAAGFSMWRVWRDEHTYGY